jgi:hypothetical protein
MTSQASGKPSLGSFLSDQMTPSAQYGLVALIVLLGVFGLKQLGGEVSQLRSQAERAASDLAILSNDDAEKTWISRSRSAEEARIAWQDHMWKAPSPGIGAAQLETALREVVGEAGIERLQLTVTPDPIERGNLSYLRYGFSGQVPPGQAHTLIAALATSKPDLIVTDLQLSSQRKGDLTIKVDGIAPFIAE